MLTKTLGQMTTGLAALPAIGAPVCDPLGAVMAATERADRLAEAAHARSERVRRTEFAGPRERAAPTIRGSSR
jgi:hypothetical protein